MSRPTIFIDGEAGTTGLQIRERLMGRDDIEIVSIVPEQRKDAAERGRLLNEVDAAILCLPDEAARAAVALIRNPAVRVLDASTAHRVQPEWEYGFPELTTDQADRIRASKRVANPGCYPTGAIALLRPLIDAGLLPADYPVTVNAVSGYSGGGRSMIESFEGRNDSPITDPVRIYALDLAHKHIPEMRHYTGLAHKPLFVPMVGAFRQGMLVQVPLRIGLLRKRVTGRELHRAIDERYAGQRFVKVLPLDPAPANHLGPETLNNTNRMELFVFENADAGQALLIARLDNLGKGASGAAVQNLDLMLGLDNDRDYSLRAPVG